ncbi:MAG: hypothetical protein WCK01_04430 [Candidatus Uhrbacteria bacterium]
MNKAICLSFLMLPVLFGAGCNTQTTSITINSKTKLNVVFERGQDTDKNPTQSVYTIDSKGKKSEIVAGVLYHFNGMNHGPDLFTVMNPRLSDRDTPKSVGEQFSVSLSNAKTDSAHPGTYLYEIEFYASSQNGNRSLGQYQVQSLNESTDQIIQLLGEETLNHPNQTWIAVGDTTFYFDKRAGGLVADSEIQPWLIQQNPAYGIEFLHPGSTFASTESTGRYSVGGHLIDTNDNFEMSASSKIDKTAEIINQLNGLIERKRYTKNAFAPDEVAFQNGKFTLVDGRLPDNHYLVEAYFEGTNFIYHFTMENPDYSKELLNTFERILASAKLSK